LMLFDPGYASLKTSRDILPKGSMTFYKTWETWVINRRGEYSVLKKGRHQEIEITSGKAENQTTKTILRESPLVKDEKNCIANYNIFALKFGFDPMARTRLQIVPYDQKPNNSDKRQPDADSEKLSRVSKMMD